MKIGSTDIQNPLEVIQCNIAFDSKDYSTDKRDRILYAIVFGWPDSVYEEWGWPKETIAEYKEMHERFKQLRSASFPLPEKFVTPNQLTCNEDYWHAGWNACIDAIFGNKSILEGTDE